MAVLTDILHHKRQEVASRKALYPIRLLEQSAYFEGRPVSLKKYLLRDDKSGVIAEIKRRSPSKGSLNKHVSIEKTSIGYMQAGASGLSILTDKRFFGGSSEDLKTARAFNFCPILRKDFIVEEYQVIEAKSIGADVILLIAAALSNAEIKRLASLTHSLGMEVLLEVHNEEELHRALTEDIDLVGVNNRDLKTLKVDVRTSERLAPHIPNDVVKISESGLSSPETVRELRRHGFQGFLIGEYFMRYGNPPRAAREFIKKLK